MSSQHASLYASLLIASTLGLSAQVTANEAPYTYSAGVALEAPIIDGVLDDPIWTSAYTTEAFVLHNDGAMAENATWAKLAYDQQYLYVAYYSQDTDITASFSQQDDPTFQNDDTVELFLDPDGDGKNYYEIGVTAKTYYDYVINEVEPWADDKAWDIAGFTHASVVNGTLNDNSDVDQDFTVEIKIPLASLNYSGNNEAMNPSTWRFNFHKADYKSDSKIWDAQWLAWSPLGSFGFHQPSKFASIDFSGADLWQQHMVYKRDQTVSYQGVCYEADYYSAAVAPGLSSVDGWKPAESEVIPFNENLIYPKGHVVIFEGQHWQAAWKTQGAYPKLSEVWTTL